MSPTERMQKTIIRITRQETSRDIPGWNIVSIFNMFDSMLLAETTMSEEQGILVSIHSGDNDNINWRKFDEVPSIQWKWIKIHLMKWFPLNISNYSSKDEMMGVIHFLLNRKKIFCPQILNVIEYYLYFSSIVYKFNTFYKLFSISIFAKFKYKCYNDLKNWLLCTILS